MENDEKLFSRLIDEGYTDEELLIKYNEEMSNIKEYLDFYNML